MHFNCRVCEETEIILIKPWHWGESKGFSIGRATNYIVPKQTLAHWRRQRTCSHLDYSDGYLIKRALCKYDTARSQDGHRQTQKLAVNRATPWPSWLRCIDKQANRIRTHLQPWKNAITLPQNLFLCILSLCFKNKILSVRVVWQIMGREKEIAINTIK